MNSTKKMVFFPFRNVRALKKVSVTEGGHRPRRWPSSSSWLSQTFWEQQEWLLGVMPFLPSLGWVVDSTSLWAHWNPLYTEWSQRPLFFNGLGFQNNLHSTLMQLTAIDTLIHSFVSNDDDEFFWKDGAHQLLVPGNRASAKATDTWVRAHGGTH